jgi:NitT/TauT family transport system substrate-binding protein
MGYMPVVTNLACPIIDEASQQVGSDPRFQGVKFNSFAEMGEALRGGHIEAAFMIAPLAIVLHQQGADVGVVYIGNRHESTLVVNQSLDVTDFGDLAGRTLAVPMRYSGHYLVARQLQDAFGSRGQAVNVVEMNPPDMPAALASGALDAYFVGEPFAFASVTNGSSEILYRVEDLWPGFICNLMVVPGDLIRERPSLVRRLVTSAARSGLWARENPNDAATIAAKHWNQDRQLVLEAFETFSDRFIWDRFEPDEEELQHLADEMKRFGLLDTARIDGLADPTFAREANLSGISDLNSVVAPPSDG